MAESLSQADFDVRESLFNDRAVGAAGQIMMPQDAVTTLHGLVVDLDPDILRPNPWFPPAETPGAFYAAIAPTLHRHPVLDRAEIRSTGGGLHALVWFNQPVELRSAAEQRRWSSIHRVLMASVPSDPACHPPITLTRPFGSINGKNGKPVEKLKDATHIPPVAVSAWAEDVARRPFLAIGLILFGEPKLNPCPYCGADGSRLDLGDFLGFCYGPCQRVPLRRLHEPFFRGEEAGRPPPPGAPASGHAAATLSGASGQVGETCDAGRSAPTVLPPGGAAGQAGVVVTHEVQPIDQGREGR
jgi:hypothetical protein